MAVFLVLGESQSWSTSFGEKESGHARKLLYMFFVKLTTQWVAHGQ